MLLPTTLLTIFCLSGVFALKGYYWREYTGHIPSDAVTVGTDLTGYDIYVGQAYFRNWGLEVVPLYNGTTEVNIVYAGIYKVNKYTYVLCGEQQNFQWVRTSHKNFTTDVKDQNVVIGGHEDGYGDIYIGRISYDGQTKIGKVLGYRPMDARFYFHDKGVQKILDASFEVMTYQQNGLQPRIKN